MAANVAVTDYDMDILSQLVYLRGAVNNETIGEFVNKYRKSINDSDESNLLRKMYRTSEKAGTLDNRKYLDYKTLLTKTDLSKYTSWKITNIDGSDYPDSAKSGLYAYIVKAGDNNIIVFRGSENPVKNINDWQSDVDLIDSVQTPQQKDVKTYMATLAEKQKISGNIYITGHSLGGNLAMYAAVAAPDYIKERLQKCDSFNGPGFYVGFVVKNAAEIKKVKDKIFAFQNENDFVSSILNSPAAPIIIRSALKNKLDAYNHAPSAFMLDGEDFVRTNSKFFIDNGVHHLSILLQFVSPQILDKIKPQILAFMKNDSKFTLTQKIALLEFFIPVLVVSPVKDIKAAGILAGGLGDLMLFEYVKDTVTACVKNLPSDFNSLCKYFNFGSAGEHMFLSISEIIKSAMYRLGNQK